MSKPTNYRGKPQRQLTEEDIASFEATHMVKPPLSTDQVRSIIMRKNRVRWWRMQNDLRWLQREMKKLKMNPEDARWLL